MHIFKVYDVFVLIFCIYLLILYSSVYITIKICQSVYQSISYLPTFIKSDKAVKQMALSTMPKSTYGT